MTEGLNEHRIFVGNLDPGLYPVLFENIFSVYGEVCNVYLNERRRFGFVSFRHKRAAEYAIEDMDGLWLLGSPTRVEWAFGWPREASGESDSDTERLAFLRTQPEFQLIRQNPQLLNTVLNQIGKKNPRLLLLIFRNKEEFFSMLHEPQGPANAQPIVAGANPLESSLGEATGIERQKLTEEQEKIRKSEELRLQQERELEEQRNREELRRQQEEEERKRIEEIRRLEAERQLKEELKRLEEQWLREKEAERQRQQQEELRRRKQEEEKRKKEEEELRKLEEHRRKEEERRQQATAPSTSVTPRISQVQSEPIIHPTGLAIASVPESVESIGATNAKETEVEEKVELTKVDKKVKETKTVDFQCKICMDDQVGVVFLPCGHMVSCPGCAQRISNCPMCRKQITGKVRTYLS